MNKDKFKKDFKKLVKETLIRESEPKSFAELFEIGPDIFNKIQLIAVDKDLVLSDFELKTPEPDNRILIDLNSENAWEQLMTYLEMEELKDKPTRTLTVDDIEKASKEESTEGTKQIDIIAGTGAGEVPSEQEMAQILAANLKVINGTLVGKPEVQKLEDKIVVKFRSAFDDPNVTPDEIKKNIGSNLDKIIQIQDIVIK